LVNNRCDVETIGVDSTEFPAIVLTRYQDLAVEVRDRKNPSSSVVKGNIFPPVLDLGCLIEHSQGLIADTAKLVTHGVSVGGDSFNLCRDSEGLRLYLNDLSTAGFEELNEQDAAVYASQAAQYALDALLGGLSWEEYQLHKEFLDGDDFRFERGKAYIEFTENVLAEAGISS
jgi:hypothetical protein